MKKILTILFLFTLLNGYSQSNTSTCVIGATDSTILSSDSFIICNEYLNFAALKHHFESTYGITIGSGKMVSYVDKANGTVVTQTTLNNQADYRYNVYNSFPAARFYLNDFYSYTSRITYSDFTMCAVVRQFDTVSYYTAPLAYGGSSEGYVMLGGYFSSSIITRDDNRVSVSNNTGATIINADFSTNLSQVKPDIITIVKQGNTWNIWKNEERITGTLAYTMYFQYIGDNTNGRPMDLYEFMLFNDDLPFTQQLNLIRTMNYKYNIY